MTKQIANIKQCIAEEVALSKQYNRKIETGRMMSQEIEARYELLKSQHTNHTKVIDSLKQRCHEMFLRFLKVDYSDKLNIKHLIGDGIEDIKEFIGDGLYVSLLNELMNLTNEYEFHLNFDDPLERYEDTEAYELEQDPS